MKNRPSIRLTRALLVRVLADALMINIALITALVLRYVWLVGVESNVSEQAVFHKYVQAYLGTFWLVTLVSLPVFYFSGFYTYGRMYRGRYKALVVAQAVSLSFLMFGFLTFLFRDAFWLPRSVPFAAWGIALVLLIGARLWSSIWGSVLQTERSSPANAPAAELQRVLVIGGAGYIGSALLPKLLDQGYSVRLLDLLLFGREPIADVIDHPRLEVVQADFRQVDKVVQAMRDIDTVIHLGAIVGDPACALDEALTIEVNVMATRMIAEVAKGSGVQRFIFASTCSVYGASDEVLNERSALNPVSLYARSKIASERVLQHMASDSFVPVILRFGTIYGLSGRTRFDLVVNLLTAKAVLDGQITVFGGDQWRPFVHVDDAALAIFTVLEAPDMLVRNQIFNVGSDSQNYTIQQVGEIIHRMVPMAELSVQGSDSDRRNYRVSFAKIRNTLGFTPRWTLAGGIEQVIDAIRMGRVHDYRDARYSNVKFLVEGGAAGLVRSQYNWASELMVDSWPGHVVAVGSSATD